MSSQTQEPVRADLIAARDGTIVADLPHNALIEVSGDDATAFLHAQFTNDVQALEEDGTQWNGWCSAKGRLLATFLLVRRPGGYLLVLPAEIAAAFTKRLGMFVLRSKVKIRDASSDYARIGIAGTQAATIVQRHWGRAPAALRSTEKDAAVVTALAADRFIAFVPQSGAPAILEAFGREATRAGADAWEWLQIRSGVPTIVTATQDAFVPQMANFELVGGVSFKKGCYPGQEIVARTQYRGILKRRMALAHVDGPAPSAGQSVYSKEFGDQAAGQVVNAAPSPEGGSDVLVVAQIDSLRSRDLRLAAPDGPPLEIRSHPATEAA
ncbi:MAG TPA: folate-binding protein [Usitatibacter sp.]|nr:folate-binding protein [Usitatibacter sp.]